MAILRFFDLIHDALFICPLGALLWALSRKGSESPFGIPANFNLWGEREHPSNYP